MHVKSRALAARNEVIYPGKGLMYVFLEQVKPVFWLKKGRGGGSRPSVSTYLLKETSML